MSETPSPSPAPDRLAVPLAFALGAFAFAATLAFHNLADGDLWHLLAQGASVWRGGGVFHSDVFAYTPTLPRWIDHEWGAGAIFYGGIAAFGPASLMVWKIAAAFAAVGLAAVAARRAGASAEAVALVAPLAAWAILPGYIPVVRAHSFTYPLFAATLLILEEARRGNRRILLAIPPMFVFWANVHGGFVAGFGTLAVYSAHAAWESARSALASTRSSGEPTRSAGEPTQGALASTSSALVPTNSALVPTGSALAATESGRISLTSLHLRWILAVGVLAGLGTLLNPYGWRYWSYIVPAILHARADIEEFRPLPFWRADSFVGFRAAFGATALLVLADGARRFATIRRRVSPPALAMLAIAAYLAWSSRRHAPFFGVAALTVAPALLAAPLARLRRTAAMRRPARLRLAVLGLYAGLFAHAALNRLPEARLSPLAPDGFYPVRVADALESARARGNLATPFRWGAYLAWRLYPEIRVSHDGRYETAYPEATHRMNHDFFFRTGPDPDRLLREAPPDFVAMDLSGDRLGAAAGRERLRPEHLAAHGYETVWLDPGYTALAARRELAPALREAVANLPPTTIEPLNAGIAADWPFGAGR